ncbi:hypothetical protein NL478_27725, partial [Klebsiella pneumoniae]|nr:hypothetical protein [Klebsiella pneumoniae]
LEKLKGAVADAINAQLAKNKKFVDDVRNLITRYLSVLNTAVSSEPKGEDERNNKNNASNHKTAGKDEKNNAVATTNNQQ